MLFFTLLVGAIVVIGAIFCDIIIEIYHKTLRHETFPSSAKVCRFEYKEEYTTTTMTMIGKTLVPRSHHHAEEYNVYVMYDGEEYCKNNPSHIYISRFDRLIFCGKFKRCKARKGKR